ncbi:Cytochrome P450 724B1 [Dichanthelium oligosanthes]|uniref:Cytochrome P450 724B1 n=1 Tax=Dichanthelium oligosanthes TaxID=888268 RepID=A0A1E5V225_9POAL|nr:Cytochrome P450 724B1 [Dichanthelium oligosanthes]
MVAGGSGITPIYQVIQAVLRDQPEDQTVIHLVYANRTEDDILLRDELDRWAAEYPDRLKVWYVISQARRPEEGWKYSVGVVTEAILREHVPEGGDDTLALACGPPLMIQFAVSPNLEKMNYWVSVGCMNMMVAVPLLAAFAAVILATVVFRHFAPLLRNPGGVPRGSFGWPLVGETLGFLRPHASTTTGSFLHDHIIRYGAVFKSHLFGAPTVVSCDAELNHFVLQNEGRLFQCSYPGPVRGILGESSLLVVTGERHRRLRSVFLALVASTGLRPSYLADVDRAACRIVASWRGRRAVTFCDEAKKFTFGVIVEQVLGLSADEPATSLILQDYNTFMEGLISFPLNVPGTSYARAVKVTYRRDFLRFLGVVIAVLQVFVHLSIPVCRCH